MHFDWRVCLYGALTPKPSIIHHNHYTWPLPSTINCSHSLGHLSQSPTKITPSYHPWPLVCIITISHHHPTPTSHIAIYSYQTSVTIVYQHSTSIIIHNEFHLPWTPSITHYQSHPVTTWINTLTPPLGAQPLLEAVSSELIDLIARISLMCIN